MLDFKTKLSYGVGGISDNALYTLIGTYLLLYLATVAGVKPEAAGMISAIGSVWEAVVAPMFGSGSDRTFTRLGRRRPFILAAAIPLATVTAALFSGVGADGGARTIYYGVMIVLFWTFFSMEFIPYLSLGADLTEDYNQRTVLRSYAIVFNQVGMLLGMVLPPIIVSRAEALGKTAQEAWQLVGIIVGACAGISLLICGLATRHGQLSRSEWRARKKALTAEKASAEKQSILGKLREFASILKLRPALTLVGASMVYLIADMIFSSSRVFYMTYNLGMGEREISLIMLIITLGGLAFVPPIAWLANRTDKKTVFMWGIGAAGTALIVFRLAGVNSMGALIAVGMVFDVANTCYWQLMPAMIYDVSEADELVSGRSRSGSVISLQSMSESVSIAVAVQALGLILGAAGFNESAAVQPESALTWVSNTFTLIPGIFMMLVFVIMLAYPINRKTYGSILEALEKKRAEEKK